MGKQRDCARLDLPDYPLLPVLSAAAGRDSTSRVYRSLLRRRETGRSSAYLPALSHGGTGSPHSQTSIPCTLAATATSLLAVNSMKTEFGLALALGPRKNAKSSRASRVKTIVATKLFKLIRAREQGGIDRLLLHPVGHHP
jgi:hypothetical protein